MSHDRYASEGTTRADEGTRDGGRAPGTRTLSQELPARRHTAGPSPAARLDPITPSTGRAVQRAIDDAFRPDLPASVHEAAALGTSGAGGALPHLATIQPLFGPHDVTGVVAHQDDAARAGARRMGAQAFATGDQVAFAGAPSLHTAAHEAAHVVQQRAGVHLLGGVGQADDPYERHADAVADRVVRGEYAADLLDQDRPSAPARAVQRKIRLDRDHILSSKSEIGEVDGFLDTHGGEDPALRRYLLDRIVDEQVHEIKQVLEARPERELVDDEARDELNPFGEALTFILGSLLTRGEYVFNNPPLESSGDIYHTVGFLAILREGGLPLPRVVIGYHPPATVDSPTWVNASRAVEFAQALGFGDRVVALECPAKKSAGRLNAKLKLMRETIAKDNDKSKRGHHPILDQKVSTALIAHLMQVLGRGLISTIIGEQLTSYGNGISEPAQVASDEWVETQLQNIRKVAGKRPLVLFNERIASNQLQHNSEGPEFSSIRQQVDQLDFAHYTLRSHGNAASKGDDQSSSPSFAGVGKDGRGRPDGFNTKVQHLQLLVRIRDEFGKQLIGIYGSTSGTLDAAALVGIRTLSLHEFGNDRALRKLEAQAQKRRQKDQKDHKSVLDLEDDSEDDSDEEGLDDFSRGVNEQDQRELLMAPFKSVVRRDTSEKDGGASSTKAFLQWLLGKYKGPQFTELELGGLAPLYGKFRQRGSKKAFNETEGQLTPQILETLKLDLEQLTRGIDAALGDVTTTGGQHLALTRGSATGSGMNCLIHTMVQLAANADQSAGPEVVTIRTTMIEAGVALGGEMLDPYQDGHGAALMEEFRRRGFGTQILQWTGGRLIVHPAIGGNPVRLLLHSGNHFEPLWGNNGAAIGPSLEVAGEQPARGQLDKALKNAIAKLFGK